MRTLLQFLPVFVFLLVVVSIARNALRVARRLAEQKPAPRPADSYDPAMSERTRRIQEDIRRKIAERRGPSAALPPPPLEPMPEPVFERPVTWEEPPLEPTFSPSHAAVLERQQQLADQMRALEIARLAEQRRTAQVSAAVKTAAESEGGMLAGSRGDLLADLREPRSLRRAFVLREVLGAPVGLR
jgi:hypothetical protein